MKKSARSSNYSSSSNSASRRPRYTGPPVGHLLPSPDGSPIDPGRKPFEIMHDPAALADPRGLGAAYEKLLPAAWALPERDLIHVNLDVPMVASMAIAVAGRMVKHRAFYAALPMFDMEAFDGLEAAGHATALAHADYCYAIRPPDPLETNIARAFELRGILQTAGEAIADGGLLSRDQVMQLRGGASHRAIALALSGWVRILLQSDWTAIKSRSMLNDELLREAGALSLEILAATGTRALDPEMVAAVTNIRQRMFTIAMRRYDQVRRGAMFLCWDEGNVDMLVPSIYSKALRKVQAPRAGTTFAPGEADPGAALADALRKIEPPPASPAESGDAVQSEPVNPPVIQSDVARGVGLPNSNPFIG